MDLLFKRYASPFLFLDGLLELGKLEEGIKYLLEEENDEKLWQLYLHSNPSKSFNEWKKDINSNDKPKGLSSEEVITQVEKSKDILKAFHF